MNILPGPVGASNHPNLLGALLSRLASSHAPLQPEDNGSLAGAPPVMAYQNNQPVYYGTPEAKALAVRGLQNVAAAHGTNGPHWRAAVQAALGVLGPDFQADASAFSPGTLQGVRAQQHQSPMLRQALAARLALGAGGGL